MIKTAATAARAAAVAIANSPVTAEFGKSVARTAGQMLVIGAVYATAGAALYYTMRPNKAAAVPGTPGAENTSTVTPLKNVA